MTPKEKAKQLLDRFLPIVRQSDLYDTYHNKAKECALIAVEEVLEWTKKPILKNHFPRSTGELTKWEYSGFWLSVKEEIEKLW
jgi:hypothetical protein